MTLEQAQNADELDVLFIWLCQLRLPEFVGPRSVA